jgi:hypothetical protein
MIGATTRARHAVRLAGHRPAPQLLATEMCSRTASGAARLVVRIDEIDGRVVVCGRGRHDPSTAVLAVGLQQQVAGCQEPVDRRRGEILGLGDRVGADRVEPAGATTLVAETARSGGRLGLIGLLRYAIAANVRPRRSPRQVGLVVPG